MPGTALTLLPCLQADGSLWHSMLERDGMPLTDDRQSATSTDQTLWGKGTQMYGGDLFGANELPETYTATVRSPHLAWIPFATDLDAWQTVLCLYAQVLTTHQAHLCLQAILKTATGRLDCRTSQDLAPQPSNQKVPSMQLIQVPVMSTPQQQNPMRRSQLQTSTPKTCIVIPIAILLLLPCASLADAYSLH